MGKTFLQTRPKNSATVDNADAGAMGFDVDLASGLPFVKDEFGNVTFTILSAEVVRDLIAAAFIAGASGSDITVTQDDPNDKYILAIKTGVVTEAMLAFAIATQGELDTETAARIAADALKENTANKSTDVTLGGVSPSNTFFPTQAAVKSYTDTAIVAAVVGLADYRGTYDASGNVFPSAGGSGAAGAVLKADFWICSVQGTLGGVVTSPGSLIISKQDAPGQTAGNWDLVEHEFSYAPEDSANKSNDTTMAADSATLYPTQHAAKGYADAAVATGIATRQPLDLTLTNLAAQNWALDAIPVGTGTDTVGQVSLAANRFLAKSSAGAVAAKTITDQAFTWLTHTTSAAQTAALDAATQTARGTVRETYVNLREFGAVGDNSTDDTTAIQAWLTALAAGGCGVVPKGQFIFSSLLTLPLNNFTMMGVDRGAAQLVGKSTFTTGDMIRLQSGGDQVSIRNLWITMQGATERTTGASINLNGCHDVILDSLTVYYPYIGLQVSGGSTKTYAQNIDIKVPTKLTTAANSAGILLDNGTTGDTYLGPHINIESAGGAGKCQDGIRIEGTGYVQLTEIASTAADVGCNIVPGAAKTVLNVFGSKCLWDTNASVGLKINAASATSTIRQVRFQDSWAAGCTAGPGIQTTGTAGGILDDLAWVGGRVLSNSTHGIQHGFGTNTNILGNTIAGNSVTTPNTSDGINVAANVTGGIIQGNRITAVNTFPNQQRYNVNVLAGSGDGFNIQGNDLTAVGANNTGPISFNATGSNNIVKDNVGCPNPRNSVVTTGSVATYICGGGIIVPKNSVRIGTTFRAKGKYRNAAATAVTNIPLGKYGAGSGGAPAIGDTTVATAVTAVGTALANFADFELEMEILTLGASGTARVSIEWRKGDAFAAVTGFHNAASILQRVFADVTIDTTAERFFSLANTQSVAASTVTIGTVYEVIY